MMSPNKSLTPYNSSCFFFNSRSSPPVGFGWPRVVPFMSDAKGEDAVAQVYQFLRRCFGQFHLSVFRNLIITWNDNVLSSYIALLSYYDVVMDSKLYSPVSM